MLSFSICLNAQTELFQSLEQKNSLSAAEQSKLDRYTERPQYCNVRPVIVGDLAESMVGNELHVNLPDEECPAVFRYKSSFTDEQGGFTWFGELYDDDKKCSGGEFLYYELKGRVYGRLQTEENAYEFKDIGGGKSALYCESIDYNEKDEGWECGIDPTDEPPQLTNFNQELKGEELCLGRGSVSLLVLYTPGAQTQDADVEAACQLAVAQMRQALVGSRVNPDDLRITLMGIEEFDYEPANGFDINEAINQVNDGRLENLIEQKTADLVCVVTEDVFPGTFGAAPRGPNSDRPVCISEVGTMTGLRTLAHEVGHQLGAEHNVSDEEPLRPGSPHAFKWQTGLFDKTRTTILARHRFTFAGSIKENLRKRGRRMVTYYSTPLTELDDVTIGNNEVNNAAGIMATNGPTVAQFNPNSPLNYTFAAWVDGPFNPCACEENVYTVSSRCAQGTVTQQWHTTTNGVDYVYQGGGTSFEYVPSCAEAQSLTIRLTATDGFTTFVSSKSTWANPFTSTYVCGNNFSSGPVVKSQNGLAVKSIFIYPNPVKKETSTSISFSPEFTDGEVTIYSLTGEVFAKEKIAKSNMEAAFPNSGVYIINAKNVAGNAVVRKIVVQ